MGGPRELLVGINCVEREEIIVTELNEVIFRLKQEYWNKSLWIKTSKVFKFAQKRNN